MSGKRERGEVVCASLRPGYPVSAALPVTEIYVDGAMFDALIDSGCSHCVVNAPCCASWTRKSAHVLTVSVQKQRCEGVGCIRLRVRKSDSVAVDVYVVDLKPVGFEFILRINGISALGGVTILPSLRSQRVFGRLRKTKNRSAPRLLSRLTKRASAGYRPDHSSSV